MSVKVIRLRYPATCAACREALPAGTRAWWDAEARSATCQSCGANATPELPGPAGARQVAAETDAPVELAAGQAGGSARREFEKRHQRREERIDQRWGRLAGVVKFLSYDPQSTMAWAKGSEGEQRLAARLLRTAGDRAVLLHDRKVPRTRGNIDHLAIAASGVWVVDAKHYRGLVELRDKGGWSKSDYRLYVGGRDRTTILEGLSWQVSAVRSALGATDVIVNAVVCFVEAEWKFFAKPFQLNGVWVTWGTKLAEMIAAPGPLSPADVTCMAERLAAALPPAVGGTIRSCGGLGQGHGK